MKGKGPGPDTQASTLTTVFVKGKGAPAYERACKEFRKAVQQDGLIKDIKTRARNAKPGHRKRAKQQQAAQTRKKQTARDTRRDKAIKGAAKNRPRPPGPGHGELPIMKCSGNII